MNSGTVIAGVCAGMCPAAPQTPGRLWLPVAPGCNIQCRFCGRRQAMRGAMWTGSSGRCLTPDEAVDRVISGGDGAGPLQGIELAGPGESLVNASTYAVLRKLKWLYPDIPVSISTNGLLLSDRLEHLARLGVKDVAIALYTASPETAEHIYAWAVYRTRKYIGREAADLILRQQWTGLANAVEAGFSVTARLVSIPGVNEAEVPFLSACVRELGAEPIVVSHPGSCFIACSAQ